MTEFQINDYILSKECDDLAREIFNEVIADMADDETPEDYRDEMSDRAHETADGHEWVIYNYKALMLCAHCDTTRGEDFMDDVGAPSKPDIYDLACMLAFGEMRGRIEAEIDDLIEAWADEHEDA